MSLESTSCSQDLGISLRTAQPQVNMLFLPEREVPSYLVCIYVLLSRALYALMSKTHPNIWHFFWYQELLNLILKKK